MRTSGLLRYHLKIGPNLNSQLMTPMTSFRCLWLLKTPFGCSSLRQSQAVLLFYSPSNLSRMNLQTLLPSQVSPIVFSTPASSILVYPYQPDPEEIPAGALAPFFPPPPIFCPLPPTGPDSDINMSVFGGAGRPLQVLFCRICNSGKPLVVRADYAIWCQDCCAFVSKADTYMGTVRAPGQLKGIF